MDKLKKWFWEPTHDSGSYRMKAGVFISGDIKANPDIMSQCCDRETSSSHTLSVAGR